MLGRLFGAGFFGLAPSRSGGNDPGREGSNGTDTATEGAEAGDSESLAELLVEQSVLRRDEERAAFGLTGPFRRDWRRRIDRARDGERAQLQLAMLLGVDPRGTRLERRDGRFVARQGETTVGAWPSRAAFLADVALYPTIEEWLPRWTDLDGEARGELLAWLRAFLERCPACGGPLRAEEAADSEASRLAVAITCSDCQQVVVTGSY